MGKRKLSQNKRFHMLITLPVIVILLFSTVVFLSYFRVNNKVFTSSLTGYVASKETKPTDNVTVCISTNCTTTDNKGLYVLDNLESGLTELSVSSNNFEDITQLISLNPGSNKLNLTVTPANLVSGKIVFTSSDEFQPKDIDILFDQKETVLDKNYSLIFENIKAGVYPLSYKSSKFIDDSVDVIFEDNGSNETRITLIPEIERNLLIKDFVSGQLLENVVITHDDNKAETDDLGLTKLSEISENVKISITKEDYLSQDILLTALKPNDKNQTEVRLVPKGKTVFVKKTNSGNQVFISNIDGSETRQLTTKGNNSNPWYDEENGIVYFTRQRVENKKPYIFTISETGENQIRITDETEQTIVSGIDHINYKADRRVYKTIIDEKEVLVKEQLSGANSSTILETDGLEIRNGILSANGKTFYYSQKPKKASENSQDSGIYSISMNLGLKNRISDDIDNTGVLADVKSNNQHILIKTDTTLYEFNLSTKSLTELAPINNSTKFINYSPDSKTIYLLQDKLLKTLKDGDFETLSTIGVDVFSYGWISDEVLYFESEDALWVISTSEGSKPIKIVDGIIATKI